MARYIYKINRTYSSQYRGKYNRRRIAALLAVIVVLVAAWFIWRDLKHNKTGYLSIGAPYTQTVAGPSRRTISSPYFQFTTTDAWQPDKHDSTDTKFVYLLDVSGVPAHMLTVYINQTPLQNDLATNRVLPVTITGGNSFKLGQISEPCGSLYKPSDLKRIKEVSLGGTTMLCVPDAPQYSVVLGQVGGNYDLTLRRQDGQPAQYIIIYHNLSVDPEPTPLTAAMQTFKAI